MNTLQRIVKNTGIFFVAQVFTYIIAFFYTIYTARYLGAEGFGILTFGLAFTLIFGVITDLGLSTLTVREVSRDKSLIAHYTGNIIVIKLFLSIVTLISIAVILKLNNYSLLTVQVVCILALWMVTNSFSQLFYSIFQAHEKMEYQSIASLINSAILFAGVFYGIFQGSGVLWFAFVYLLASVIVLIYCILLFNKIYKNKLQKLSFGINGPFWKSTILAALPLSIASIFSIIAFRVDSVLLSLIQGAAAVGLYNAAYKLIECLMFIPIVYTAAIFPVLSNFHISSKESLELLYKKSVKYSIILGLPIAVVTTAFAPEMISLLYGSSYNSAIIPLQILIWTIPLLFLNYIFVTLLISINKQNLTLKITFGTMIFNVVMNLILIPEYSYIAASFITVITELLGSIMCFYYLSKYVAPLKLKEVVLKPVLATLIVLMFIIITPVKYTLAIIALILYLGLLFIFKVFSRDDYDLFRKMMKSKLKG